MKKLIAFTLAVILIISLCACGNSRESTLTKTQSAVETLNLETYHHSTSFIVFFSTTNHTVGVASFLSQALKADMMQLKPAKNYTKADTNTDDENCRAKKEADDPSVRPEIVSPVSHFDQYDTIYIGYPIWYGKAPRIINTFLESYDFTGKKVYLFCTSKESSIKESFEELKTTYPDINIADGKRFPQDVKYTDVSSWLYDLGELKEEANE